MDINMPVLYSFRRCPYAIRARMAIAVSGQRCALREVILRNKPSEMITVSPKATVPVIVLSDGKIIDESLTIMLWALKKNDPEEWLKPMQLKRDEIGDLIAENDGPFKDNLDRYKYSNRYKFSDPLYHRRKGVEFLTKLNTKLLKSSYLYGNTFTFADAAISPFVRQFANHDREWFESLALHRLQGWLTDILESRRFLDVMGKYPAWENGATEPMFPKN